MSQNLESFSYNKLVANLHEIYGFLIKRINKSYKKETLKENYEQILIAINPIIPHFSSECLSLINSKNFTGPKYNQTLIKDENVNIVIQVNGKKES